MDLGHLVWFTPFFSVYIGKKLLLELSFMILVKLMGQCWLDKIMVAPPQTNSMVHLRRSEVQCVNTQFP